MTEGIIDFHTHAFPDSLAPRAMKKLIEEAPDVKAYLDGTIGSLLGSMDNSGIDKSVVCCIATRPEQFEPIFEWCKKARSERIIFFPSVHPGDPKCIEQIGLIKHEGFKGIKLHPFYQEFYADEQRLFEMYRKLCDEDMMIVMHTGFDIAFPKERRADPEKLLKIKNAFPKLKFITTHLGAWQQWDEVQELLLGQEIYMEISFAFDYMSPETAGKMLMCHPEEYILFGTDSPWTDQEKTLLQLKNLMIPEKKLERILSRNAMSLLGLSRDRLNCHKQP
ncbi:MAG: amidohydrolase [Planctomycetes bacterium RBG_19FT_COMBO_48_8]|nr:MAG: amidohydrolase [Planctomycetes bacterium RBG_19FT_COMBO_48_8]